VSSEPNRYPPIRYPVVLLDLDHTLYDFDVSKAESFATAMLEQGIEDPVEVERLKAVLSSGERPLWAQVESGELDLTDLNQARFDYLQSMAMPTANASQMAATYRYQLGRTGGLYPGARDLLVTLNQQCRLGLITNGYGDVQRSRMAIHDLDQYFDAVSISAEIGLAKPDPAFFAHTFAQLNNPARSEMLVVGDSLTSDMAGGVASDLDTCWYNPHEKPNTTGAPVTHEVAGYDEIVAIVLGRD